MTAFVVNAVNQFSGAAFLQKDRQVVEIIDIRRHDSVNQFMHKRPVQLSAVICSAVRVGEIHLIKERHIHAQHARFPFFPIVAVEADISQGICMFAFRVINEFQLQAGISRIRVGE